MVERLFCDKNMGFSIFRSYSLLFNVCTYLIETNDLIYIIDPGKFSNNFYEWMSKYKDKTILVFITHEHFDHHYDLNKIQENFNSTVFIPSLEFKSAIEDSKKNLSYYLGDPIKTEITNYTNKSNLKVYKTPGHSQESYCYKYKNYLFSGDTIIEKKYLTFKFPGSNKLDYFKSVDFIKSSNPPNTIVLPGHGDFFYLNSIE